MIKNNVEHSAISVLWMLGRGGQRSSLTIKIVVLVYQIITKAGHSAAHFAL